MKQELNYSTREINQNFKMKVYGRNEEGKKVDTLMGVSGLILLAARMYVLCALKIVI